MGSMFKNREMRIALFLSLAGHLLFLGMPGGARQDLKIERDDKELEIAYVKIKEPTLLPRIDNMGEEKKLKEIKEKPKSPAEPEPVPETVAMEKEPSSREKIDALDLAQEAMLRYQDMVKQRIEEARRYPSWAKRQGQEGIVYLDFIVLANGLSRDIEIISSSGSGILDKEAVATIQRAGPFPPIPQGIKRNSTRMQVAIVFALD
ncbi:MAG: energy transducer TonB [Candidatus Omnitrophota bacterium]|nr:MAG: energy transducer TonB [Candidatus Omnitrophota bacterium]